MPLNRALGRAASRARPARKPALWLLGALLLALSAPAPALPASPAAGELLMDIPDNPVKAFDFAAALPGGGSVRLSDFLGKVVFLNFWATWCVPCLTEMPAMERLHRQMDGAPFKMLAVNIKESPERVLAFAKELELTFALVLDRAGDIAGNYATTVLPTTYIIDKAGYVVRRALGAREWDSPAAVHFFRQLSQD